MNTRTNNIRTAMARLLTIPALAIGFLVLAPLAGQASAQGQDDLFELLEQARKAATVRVAPSIVRIETVGGLETVNNVLIGQGPTTGVIVSQDGYIVSSAFNFAQSPASILVGLPDGTRVPAELIARDHNRMLVLLKMQEAPEGLVVPEVVPTAEMQVGQWTFAMGRTYDSLPPAVAQPHVSQGIISALGRIWGKAIQTDAKVSPTNYGGPLVDLQGRVLGILAPMSPQGGSDVAGHEWYDSGIGFAIPLENVMAVLPRWKEGDLHPGVLGVNLQGGNQFADAAVIAVVRPNSPAAQAGFKANDTIVEIGGKEIVRQTQVKEALGPFYAGDTVTVAVERDGERITADVLLVDKMATYDRPFLGVLPQRPVRDLPVEGADEPAGNQDQAEETSGVIIRHVYPGSPAAAAGLQAGDVVTRIEGRQVAGATSMRDIIAEQPNSGSVSIIVNRGDDELTLESNLESLPEAVPADLPSATPSREPFAGQQPPVGKQNLKIPEFENGCVLYVPPNYDPRIAYGLIVYLHEPGTLTSPQQEQDVVDRWSVLCERYDLILVAPKSRDPIRWQPAVDEDFVVKIVGKVQQDYSIDESRIAAHGYKAGGAFGYALASSQRQIFRAVCGVECSPGRPQEADPGFPLAIMATTHAKAANLPQLNRAFDEMRNKMRYPVTVLDLGEEPRNLNDDELDQFARWLDSLDRI